MMRKVWIAALLIVPFSTLAQTSDGTPTRIRGTVEQVDGANLIVKTRSGQTVTVKMAPNFGVSGVVKKELADIKAGDFVASTSVRTPDGKLRALEVHFLPAGASQGQFAYDLLPESVMTNAVVSGITSAADGRTLRVSYKGTEADVVVPTDVPVVAFVPGDLSLVKAGSAIVVAASRAPDGTLNATRATLEKDGVKPPM
jgi:hypothetical protein